MKILCSSTSRVPSETANSIQVLMACEGLQLCGHDVTLIIPGEGEADFESIRGQYGLHCKAFPIRRIPSKPMLKRLDFSAALIREAKKTGADCSYTWTIQAAALAAVSGLFTAFEVHDLPTGNGRRWFDLYTRTKTPKKILFITAALRDKMLGLYPHLKAEDCRITPNGISPEDYDSLPDLAEAKARMGFPADRITVSCSGHLYAGRGSGLFLELASRFPEADFRWFGGNPSDVAACRQQAESMGLSNVTFHGFIPKKDLPQAQAACDILLMPYGNQIAGSSGGNSAEICSPMKMFEYLACGRCILSSDLPVIHEVLDESCAIFCDPENPDSWTAGLSEVIRNADLRNSLAEEAKRRSSAYTWENREKMLEV